MNFQALPSELHVIIISYLTASEIVSISLVSHELHELCKLNQVWQPNLLFDFGFNEHPCERVQPNKQLQLLYYEFYRNLHAQHKSPIVIGNQLFDMKSGSFVGEIPFSQHHKSVSLPAEYMESGLFGNQLYSSFLQYLKHLKGENSVLYMLSLYIMVDSMSTTVTKMRGIQIHRNTVTFKAIDQTVLWTMTLSPNMRINPFLTFYYDCFPHDLLIFSYNRAIVTVERVSGKVVWIDENAPTVAMELNACYGYDWDMYGSNLASNKDSSLQGYGVISSFYNNDNNHIAGWNVITGERLWEINIGEQYGRVDDFSIVNSHYVFRMASDGRTLIFNKHGELVMQVDGGIISFHLYPQNSCCIIVQFNRIFLAKLQRQEQSLPVYSMHTEWSIPCALSLLVTESFLVRVPLTGTALLQRRKRAQKCGLNIPMEDIIVASNNTTLTLFRVNIEDGNVLWTSFCSGSATFGCCYFEVRGTKLICVDIHNDGTMFAFDIGSGRLLYKIEGKTRPPPNNKIK